MKTRSCHYLVAIIMLAALFASCKKDEPTISRIDTEINDYTVSFSAVVTDANSYLWDFGDGNTSTEANPVHEYEMSGSYTVTLTVKGDGGEASSTKVVEILPSFTEMLTGGPEATGGKTWKFSRGYTEGVNGGGIVDNNMWVMLPTMANVLELIGLGEEYDNEFTFYHDGTYGIGENNGTALTAGIYGMTSTTIVSLGNEHNDLGLVSALYTPPASATWTLHNEDLVVNAITNPLSDEVPPAISERTITGKRWVSLSEDAYFGILDFPTTRKFIVKELTGEKMEVALLVCAYWADEVWTGIEYQVASHLMLMGEAEKGLDIVKSLRMRYDGRIRNPFNEYEYGHWYARALASYGLLQGLTGFFFDAVEGIMYIDSRIGNDFSSFFSCETGWGLAGLRNGEPFAEAVEGIIPVKTFIVGDREKKQRIREN